MRSLCLIVLLAAASAAPTEERARLRELAADAKILEDDVRKSPDGSYSLAFRTDNGISQQEQGISYPGFLQDSGSYVKEGRIEYTLDNGVPVVLEYLADENGFEILNPEQLQQVLPTPPPTEYPLPQVPGAGMPVPDPLPEFNVGF
ncbi:larval cuticle protein LCP-14-like isoform X2 [Amphibalanus amphitrite]|uniref:larval cuticle protein LCP-14-like isoform X2 n=1 Tax=Amphibalanus amphitrite TaxID=1232801 RepID=UPI001C9056AA|nr:larval cuticle protein LCP-14-like isoform X2 [Amphibalanus amphitrite]XP_043195914.1 larval cuticle protein LCP-14-like isoform X2 [Amphibalanus amphitrite]